ncbi:DUF3576 domain-containing protein [Pseudooceanicola marinus]|uniref:DUF3576 domain-containing protein n=1 Tax=Pseudooceanicola marinus TaxID=396013 RepID=UPI001C954734|nr:DUF3576 domain-containing protein [Pseudooceanicola marinus]MBY5971851.1 DUF3576 domain-containing protein [Ferrimonas balearica]MCA1336227.1 DUF3576 domain-containing protein [Pseudooceanicola marinus]
MISSRAIRTVARAAAVTSLMALVACGDNAQPGPTPMEEIRQRETIWDLFNQRDDGTKVAVNRYLWNASLEVLNFLPVEQIDPFTGVITFGYGTPPGGGRAYRATVYISDPALEARSLNVSIQTRGGSPVAEGTQRAVEDAILTRARQLRVSDRRF